MSDIRLLYVQPRPKFKSTFVVLHSLIHHVFESSQYHIGCFLDLLIQGFHCASGSEICPEATISINSGKKLHIVPSTTAPMQKHDSGSQAVPTCRQATSSLNGRMLDRQVIGEGVKRVMAPDSTIVIETVIRSSQTAILPRPNCDDEVLGSDMQVTTMTDSTTP